jgi:hypothetical protein
MKKKSWAREEDKTKENQRVEDYVRRPVAAQFVRTHEIRTEVQKDDHDNAVL